MATIAYRVGNIVHAIDFWPSRAVGQAWYEENVYPTYERLRPGKLTAESVEKSWLNLHSFVVSAPSADPLRNFIRESDGPLQR
jgi:hypothetical protein